MLVRWHREERKRRDVGAEAPRLSLPRTAAAKAQLRCFQGKNADDGRDAFGGDGARSYRRSALRMNMPIMPHTTRALAGGPTAEACVLACCEPAHAGTISMAASASSTVTFTRTLARSPSHRSARSHGRDHCLAGAGGRQRYRERQLVTHWRRRTLGRSPPTRGCGRPVVKPRSKARGVPRMLAQLRRG
jgi:hypothetical protein